MLLRGTQLNLQMVALSFGGGGRNYDFLKSIIQQAKIYQERCSIPGDGRPGIILNELEI